MCEGGVVDGRVFSKVTDKVMILKDGTAPKSYKDICPVGEIMLYILLESCFRKLILTSPH